MKSLVFICPYFGKMPEQHMPLWLKSCAENPSINWIIFTDDKTQYNYPSNVRVEYMSFNELKGLIQERFSFDISLQNAYKLCDFKPTYGYVFSEYISQFKYWGYCDMTDCIFGNLRKFITDELLENNDKIGFLGHMTIYRNTEEICKRFFLAENMGFKLQKILGASENKAFDELPEYGINSIYKHFGFKEARIDNIYYDIVPIEYAFRRAEYIGYEYTPAKRTQMIFEWNRGELFAIKIKNNKIERQEIGYVHFQKRKMQREFEMIPDQYIIVPNRFVTGIEEINESILKRFSKGKLIYPVYFKQKWKALEYHMNNIIKRR